MSRFADTVIRRHAVSLASAVIDYALAAGATVILAAAIAAAARGRAEWGPIPWPIWAHLVMIGGALALTPVMLLRRRGDRLHKILGRAWVVCMIATALSSFGIRGMMHGGLGPIHLLSVFVIIMAPLAAWFAYQGNIRAHQIAIRSLIAGALVIAGAFTFPSSRLLGQWLFA